MGPPQLVGELRLQYDCLLLDAEDASPPHTRSSLSQLGARAPVNMPVPLCPPLFSQIQQVPFAHDDAWIASAGRLPCALDTPSGSLFLATSSAVVCLKPVEAEKQVWG